MTKAPAVVEGLQAQVLTENLRAAAAAVCPAAPNRATLPVLSHVRVSSDRGRLLFEASDLDVTVRHWVGAKVDREGSLTVPATFLRDVAKRLDPGEVATLSGRRTVTETIRYNEQRKLSETHEETRLTGALVTPLAAVRFLAIDVEDFPKTTSPKGAAVTFEARPFFRALARAMVCAAADDTRPVLTGVLLQPHDGRLQEDAADGFRLAVMDAGPAPTGGESWLVPWRAVRQMLRLFRSEETIEVVYQADPGVLSVTGYSGEVVTRTLQGQFPDYTKLIPETWSTRCIVDAPAFRRAVALAGVVARDGSGIVRLEISPRGGLLVSAKAEEVGEMAMRLVAAVTGKEDRIAFNHRYLTDALAGLGDGPLTFEMTAHHSQGVFRGADGPDLYVVMPMFVQWEDKPAAKRGAA